MDWSKNWKNWKKQQSSTKVKNIQLSKLTFHKSHTYSQCSVLLAGLMEHTKRLLRAFFELSQTHRGESPWSKSELRNERLFDCQPPYLIDLIGHLKMYPSSIRGCFFCHRRARAAGSSQRGFCEVCRCSPQHWEIWYPPAEDHQTCEYRVNPKLWCSIVSLLDLVMWPSAVCLTSCQTSEPNLLCRCSTI